jgi:cell wall-associated NlpC family hydrolase
MKHFVGILLVVIAGLSVSAKSSEANVKATATAVSIHTALHKEKAAIITAKTGELDVPANIDRSDYVSFAKTLLGTPYLYASTNPAKGLDCSGFVNYVSHHFNIKVPRASVAFTDYGQTVDRTSSLAGDLILFTGSDASRRIVGHMGIITENNNGQIQFIHSSSGKGKGVIISSLEGYYETRYVKIVRILG